MKPKINQRYAILIIVVVAIVGAIFYLESMKASSGSASEEGAQELVSDGEYLISPELAGISGYLNTDGEEIQISDYRGKVVLIDFWTYTCINCIRTLPFLTAWDEKYRDKGLVIIGVHTPEFEFEKDPENVQDAIDQYGIKYPVVQDNDFSTWRAFENRYWPRKYLVDAQGRIRYDHIGEGAYEETEQIIQELLDEIGEDVGDVALTEESTRERFRTTPELYAGYHFALGRGQNIGNPGGLQPEQTVTYGLPEQIAPNVMYLGGEWKSNADDLEVVGDTAVLVLGLQAAEVNIVADTLTGEAIEMNVIVNGAPVTPEQAGTDVQFDGERGFVVVDSPRLYNLLDGEHGIYVLGLEFEHGFSFNSFTFG